MIRPSRDRATLPAAVADMLPLPDDGFVAARHARLAMSPINDALDEAEIRIALDDYQRAVTAYTRAAADATVTGHIRSALGIATTTSDDKAAEAQADMAAAKAKVVARLAALERRRDLEETWRERPTQRFYVRLPGVPQVEPQLDGTVTVWDGHTPHRFTRAQIAELLHTHHEAETAQHIRHVLGMLRAAGRL